MDLIEIEVKAAQSSVRPSIRRRPLRSGVAAAAVVRG